MSHITNTADINQTFIIESVTITGDSNTLSACTTLYTNNVSSCSGDTQIFMGTGVITFDGNLYTNDNLSATTINASTFYSGGTNVFDIIRDLSITGGSFNTTTDTLTLNKGNNSTVIVTGFTDYYTTGTTIVGNTVYFNRNDMLSAYTMNLSSFSADTYVSGVTFTNNNLIIGRNDGVNLNTFINTFTGLTINGNLNVDTISATTYLNLPTDIRVTGGTYAQNTGTATFTNNTGGTFSVSGFLTGDTMWELFAQINYPASIKPKFGVSVVPFSDCQYDLGYDNTRWRNLYLCGGVSASTISATTYVNLPTDIRVTGGTYSNGTAVFTNNTGGTFSVSGFSIGSSFTGGTVSGGTNFTGGLSANTLNIILPISGTSAANLAIDVSGNVITASTCSTCITLTSLNGATWSVGVNNSGSLVTTQLTPPMTIPLTGLKIWLDANESTTIFTSDSGTGAISNGATVGYWGDLSGQGNHIKQSNASFRPTWNTNQLNSLPTVRFDGINDWLQAVTFTWARPSTVFIVMQRLSTTGSVFDGQLGNSARLYGIGGNSMNLYGDSGSVSVPTGSYYLIRVEERTGAIDSITVDNGTPFTSSTFNNGTFNGFILGDTSFIGDPANVEVAEVIGYDRLLSVSESGIVWSYLGDKYNITI